MGCNDSPMLNTGGLSPQACALILKPSGSDKEREEKGTHDRSKRRDACYDTENHNITVQNENPGQAGPFAVEKKGTLVPQGKEILVDN